MSKGGRYLRRKAPGGKKKKVLLIVLLSVLVLLAAIIIGVCLYVDSMLDLMTDKQDESFATMSAEELDQMLNPFTEPPAGETEEETAPPISTVPEDTWPIIESTENITNIMVVGQAARYGEEYKLSDTMILFTINRETNTVTMTSFLRDMYVTLPAYAGHGMGANRINVAYHLGSQWMQSSQGGMEMLELTIKQNFDVEVDHTVEVNFEAFEKIVDILGGVEVELSEREAESMNNLNGVEPVEVGYNVLTGNQALHYARMRKIDGDPQRTARQRALINTLVNKLRGMNIMDVHELFTTVLPLISTNMTNAEIMDYAWEFIPMLKDINIVSQSIPAEGTYWSENMGSEEVPNYVLKWDTWNNKRILHESLGLIAE